MTIPDKIIFELIDSITFNEVTGQYSCNLLKLLELRDYINTNTTRKTKEQT